MFTSFLEQNSNIGHKLPIIAGAAIVMLCLFCELYGFLGYVCSALLKAGKAEHKPCRIAGQQRNIDSTVIGETAHIQSCDDYNNAP